MNKHCSLKETLCLFSVFAFASLAIPGVTSAVSLDANDDSTIRSFDDAGNWDDGLLPSSGKDYFTGSFELRVYNSDAVSAFAGDSLTVETGGELQLRTTVNVAIDNLTLNGGLVRQSQAGGASYLSGNNMSIGIQGITFLPNSNHIYLTSSISGSGALTLNPTSGSNRLELRNTNTYSGGTFVIAQTLMAKADGALGTGDVTIATGASLILQGGSSHQYIYSDAQLLMNATSLLNLNFEGTNNISALSFDGGSTFEQSGLWGAVGNESADFQSSQIVGNGLISVIPESGAFSVLLGFAMCFLVFFRRIRG